MVRQTGKKQSGPVTAAVLVFAVIGTFIFSTTPISNNTETENKPYSTGVFAAVIHTIDWLAETNIEYRINRFSSSTLRGGMSCMLMPVETYDAAHYLTALSVHTIESDNFSNTKNVIPLKLRI
jgi:hypothetical protein